MIKNHQLLHVFLTNLNQGSLHPGPQYVFSSHLPGKGPNCQLQVLDHSLPLVDLNREIINDFSLGSNH
jgi:hypothetical protein